jgi:hypothetical protein
VIVVTSTGIEQTSIHLRVTWGIVIEEKICIIKSRSCFREIKVRHFGGIKKNWALQLLLQQLLKEKAASKLNWQTGIVFGY